MSRHTPFEVRNLDRRIIDRARDSMLGEDSSGLPVCTAPFAGMVLDGDGTVRACEATTTSLTATGDDLRKVFRSAELGALR